jgi:hypothetical protein
VTGVFPRLKAAKYCLSCTYLDSLGCATTKSITDNYCLSTLGTTLTNVIPDNHAANNFLSHAYLGSLSYKNRKRIVCSYCHAAQGANVSTVTVTGYFGGHKCAKYV